jgi:hypothetical protein
MLSGQLRTSASISPGKDHRYTSNWRPSGPQGQLDTLVKRNTFYLAGNRAMIPMSSRTMSSYLLYDIQTVSTQEEVIWDDINEISLH